MYRRFMPVVAAVAIAAIGAVALVGSASAQSMPVANPGGPYAGTIGQAIQFNGGNSQGYGLTFIWDFGDGTRASGPVVSHAFSAAQVYNVRLTVMDANGLSATATTQASVSGYSGYTGYAGYAGYLYGYGVNGYIGPFGYSAGTVPYSYYVGGYTSPYSGYSYVNVHPYFSYVNGVRYVYPHSGVRPLYTYPNGGYYPWRYAR